MEQKKYFIIDFDSTFVQTETLEELANVVLKNNYNKKEILQEIKNITNLGMEGQLSFEKSLQRRLKLIMGTRWDIKAVVRIFKRKITQSIKRNKQFFKKYYDQIYIVSGGFKECIIPVVKPFSIAPNHILANTFKFNEKGQITGYDENNPLGYSNGKTVAVKKLQLPGTVCVIGDGYTDFQIKQLGAAEYFIAFTENVTRQVIIKNADFVVQNFDELLNLKYNKRNENHSSGFGRRNCLQESQKFVVVNLPALGT